MLIFLKWGIFLILFVYNIYIFTYFLAMKILGLIQKFINYVSTLSNDFFKLKFIFLVILIYKPKQIKSFKIEFKIRISISKIFYPFIFNKNYFWNYKKKTNFSKLVLKNISIIYLIYFFQMIYQIFNLIKFWHTQNLTIQI